MCKNGLIIAYPPVCVVGVESADLAYDGRLEVGRRVIEHVQDLRYADRVSTISEILSTKHRQ